MIQPEFTKEHLDTMKAIAWVSKDKLLRGEPIEDAILYFINRCEANDIPIHQMSDRAIGDMISGGLRELDDSLDNSIELFLCGPTNSGKDLLLKLLFDEWVLSKMKKVLLPNGEEVALLDDKDTPDKTQYPTRLPLSEGPGGIVLVNSSGFIADDPEIEDATRCILRLPTLTEEVKGIGLIDAGKHPVSHEWIPVEEIENRFCFEKRVVLYLLDLSTRPLGLPLQESIRNDLQTLRLIYGDRLIVCGSHSDILQNWDETTRRKRQAIWERTLGEDLNMLEYSGIDDTRKGILAILRAILTAAGEDPKILLPYLQSDLKKSSLTYSLYHFSGLLTSTLSNVDQDAPYSHLRAGITLACSLYCSLYYNSGTAEEYLEHDGRIKKILTIAKEGITSEDKVRARKPRGFLERLSRWWSGKQFHETVTVFNIGNTAIGESCALIYSLIHFLEDVSSPLIPENEVERFFNAYLEKHNAQTLLRERSSQALQRVIAQGFIKFFQKYHPQTLEFRTKLSR